MGNGDYKSKKRTLQVGEKFNYYTVLSSKGAVKSNGYKHLCQCACGNRRRVNKTYLIHGKSKSCGCQGCYPGIVLPDGTKVISVRKKALGGGRSARTVKVRCVHGVEFTSRRSGVGPRNKWCPCIRGEKFAESMRVHGESPHSVRTAEYNTWRQIRQRCNYPGNVAYKHYGGRGIKVCKRWDKYSNFLSDMGRKTIGDSIERVDVNGDYSPKNCIWIPMHLQQKNKRTTIRPGRKFCKNGHRWQEFCFLNKDGYMACRKCIREASKRHHAKKKDESRIKAVTRKEAS